MLTITVSVRALALGIIGCAALAAGALYAPGALGSDDVPDQVVLGDINCDGLVNELDALGALLHTAGFDVDQQEPCFLPGSVAAIPGPAGAQGPQGLQGPQGPAGEAATTYVASVTGAGSLTYGSATSASRASKGRYIVTFDADVSQCATVAGAGLVDGLGPVPAFADLWAYPDSLDNSGEKVIVQAWDPSTPGAADSSFHLIVVC